MPRKTDFEILKDYVDYLNGVCNQIITDSRLVVLNQKYISCFQDGAILPLRLRPQGFLHFHQLVSVRSGKVIVEDCGYHYSLSLNPYDEEQWIFRYDYRLNPQDNYPHSHLHVNAHRGDEPLRDIHFPTARVSIEQIIAHLIIEHQIVPKCTNWFDILAKSHCGFMKRRTDPLLFP